MAFEKLIGTPYEKLNCWDVAREFYRLEFNAELLHSFDNPNDRDLTKDLIYSNIGKFEGVRDPQFGDLVLIKIKGVESHIGVYVDKGLFLHTNKSSGCVLDRISVWSKVIVGFYRLRGKND